MRLKRRPRLWRNYWGERDGLEERFTAIDDDYSKAVDALGKKNAAERKQLLTQLTERERSQVADD
ncbi:hypothetical protein [Pseudomonas weihenstephanensis]|uniref:hypothetical protein n=1 Tax=Pseudomonas weihenstephanensis TaxID=1608994 RepID=UPI00193BA300|nr:hypothetical protein [Pseudomonas weihenstephanensis]